MTPDVQAALMAADLAGLDGESPRELRDLDDAPAAPTIRTVRACDITPRAIRWLWPGRLARGKLSALAGDPGLGKSTVALDIAAALSRGGWLPDGHRAAGLVESLIVSVEDDAADTLLPRLMAADARLDRVHLFVGVGATGRGLDLTADVGALDALLADHPGVGLVVVDPYTAVLGAAKMNDAGDIRGALAPLAAVAEARGVAVLVVAHLRKGRTGSALDAVAGSTALVAATRTAFIVARDPQDDDRRLIAAIKSNIGRMPPTLGYRVADASVDDPDGARIMTSRLTWETSPVDITADELMAPPDREGRGASRVAEAEEWLRLRLAGGPVAQPRLQADAVAAGHAWATVRRARESVGAVSARDGAGWVWRLGAGGEP